MEGSPSRRRKTLISNLHCLVAISTDGKGVNLEAKSRAGVLEAVHDVLATPATSLEPVILGLAFPLDYFSDVERGDLLLG